MVPAADQRIHFSVFAELEEHPALDTFAEENARGLGNQFFFGTITALII